MGQAKTWGIGLLSGGLDSILAVKVLQRQDLKLTGVTFVTPFFGPEAGLAAGRSAGIEVEAIDIGAIHLAMVKQPRYGYGSQMNPCIDCHALMLNVAGRMMERLGADFLFTGEVLGQRPMSQRRDSLRSVENLSGYPDRVLRPLSARHLAPTWIEREQLVDRSLLLDLHGRGRKRQMELAAEFGIRDYPQPGGGCLLTIAGFAERLRALLARYPEAGPADVEFLKWGRVFRTGPGGLALVGRNQRDNETLESLVRLQDTFLHAPKVRSPSAVLLGFSNAVKDLQLTALVLAAYSDAPLGAKVRISWRQGDTAGELLVKKLPKQRFRGFIS